MKTTAEPQFPRSTPPGVPLVTMFFLLAVCGVLAKVAALGWNESLANFPDWPYPATIGIIVGGVAGTIVGALQTRPFSGILIRFGGFGSGWLSRISVTIPTVSPLPLSRSLTVAPDSAPLPVPYRP